MDDNVFVSVIIPTYNRCDYISASIDSVLKQTCENLELIVVDDASEDDTAQVVASIRDERIKYYRLNKNSGAAAARNFGVDKAKYDLIAFNDSDDRWRPEKLEKQIHRFNEIPEAVLVYSAYECKKDGLNRRVPPEEYPCTMLEGDIYRYLLKNNTVGAPTILIRRDVFEKAGGFDSAYQALEDWNLVLKAAKFGKFAYVDEVLLDVTLLQDGVSSSGANYFNGRCRLLADYMEDIQAYGLFDDVCGDILKRAESEGVLDHVKKMMMLCLQEKMGKL